MAEVIITSANFKKEVLDSDIPVLVDFWASWCGPCRMLSPVLSEIAAENEGVVKVGKLNVDDEPELANMYMISSIPAVKLFKNGEVVKTSIGFRPKEEIEGMFK